MLNGGYTRDLALKSAFACGSGAITDHTSQDTYTLQILQRMLSISESESSCLSSGIMQNVRNSQYNGLCWRTYSVLISTDS
jgi:hypothetical protein